MATKLSVNINKVATIRNARGGNIPNVVQFARDCELFGAEGITVHPRPDERHITSQDVFDLAPIVKTEFNIEGYPDQRFIDLLKKTKPTQATLVPDPPNVLTSNEGWNTIEHFDFLIELVEKIHAMGIRSAIFIGTDNSLIEAAGKIGVNRVEFYTGPYAEQFEHNKAAAIAPYKHAAEVALKNGLMINAGHDLSLTNLRFFKDEIPELAEVSIGHALISDALYLGIENAINMYKKQLVE